MNDIITITRPALPAPRYQVSFAGSIAVGAAVLALTLGGLGAWSALAPLSTGVIAMGTVSVDSKRKSVQHLEGGIVSEILVRDGDMVKAGQPLLHLEETQVVATLDQLRGRHDAAEARRARLGAQRLGLDEIQFPWSLAARRETDPKVADILGGERGVFLARRDALAGQTTILENRIAQSRNQMAGLERQGEAAERQVDLLQSELAGIRGLAQRGHAPRNRVLEMERELARLEGERSEIQARIATVQQAVNEAELQIAQQRADFREEVEAQLRETETELFDLAERLRAVRGQHQRLAITAPVAGEVVDLAVHTSGGVIAPGSRILDIVPRDDRLVVEARLQPDDIDDVHPGMPADVHFSAFNRDTVPLVEGRVTTVSADRLVDQRTEQAYYLIRIEVADAAAAALGGLDLRPGMPAEVMINKDDRTLFDYFYVPMREMLARSLRQ